MEFSKPIIQSYQAALDKFLTMLQKNTKKSYIGIAIALITLQRIYSYFRVPKQLRHITSIPFLTIAKSQYDREPPYSRFKRLILPIISKNSGLYVSKVPFDWTVHIANPIAARQVLMKAESNPKSHEWLHNLGPNAPFYKFLGDDNVGIANGKDWKRQRKIMNPAFHRSMPIKTMASIIPSLFDLIEEEQGKIIVPAVMRDLTLDILGLTIFGFDFNSMQGSSDEWKRIYTTVNEALVDPLLNIMGPFSFLLFFFPEKKRQLDAVAKLSQKLDEIAQQKRKEVKQGLYANKPENEKDLVTLMLEAEEMGEAVTSNTELRHNIAGLFLAGHDTTAHTLSFCFYNLAKNRDVQHKLRQEVLDILGDTPMDVVPTLDQLKTMEYLNLVLKENLRHNGPADNLLPRIAKEDIIVDGTLIPKGTTVNIDIYAIHHDPKNWEDVEKFIPERFAKGGEHDGHEGLTWLPFSNGSRQCIGISFSLTEQRLILAMMVRKYEISISKDSIHYDHIIMNETATKAPDSLELIFTKRY
ncbi:cytochrome P450-dit2 [Rhizopus stolonifer]|uniref:Cytochrome P450-dit2 n=1 Tax=Rhizopus stolonifer TaxID=4846 RepID=A0A367KKC6_RHIST|nr:cytochrome P450-dit2 [Rhizopus stolonifer]